MMVGPTAFAEPFEATYGEAPRCPSCSAPVGPRRWLEPYKVRLRPGTRTDKPGDAITGPGFDGFLANARFESAFNAAGLKGVVDWRPVEIRKWTGPPYRLTILPDPTARADFSRMNIKFNRPPTCPQCQQAIIAGYHGVTIDESTWAGQDIFNLTNLGVLMVTERFKALVDENEFTGLAFERAHDFTPSYARHAPA